MVHPDALTPQRPTRRVRRAHARDPNRPRGLDALGGALAAALGLLVVWPIARLLGRSWRAKAVRDVLADGRIRSVLWFSLWQTMVSVLVVMLLAAPVAAVVARYRFPGRRWLLAVASAPFTLPTVVVGSAFLALAPTSLRQSATLVISAHVFFNVGYALRSLAAAWEGIDPALQEAAATLGAPPWRVFLTVTAPLLRRATAEAAAVVGALCFTSFGVVLILGGPRRSTIDVEIYRQALSFGRFDRSAVLAMGQLVLLATVLLAARRRRRSASTRVVLRRLARRPARARDWAAVGAVGAAVLAVTVVPLLALVLRSLRAPDGRLSLVHYRSLSHATAGSGLLEPPLHALVVSLRSAALVAVLTVAAATSIATVLARSDRAVAHVLRVLTVLPLATSAVTLGLGVLVAFSTGFLAWRTSWFMIPVVQSVVALPFVLATVVPAFAEQAGGARDAAATLGASPWRAWWTVELPMRRRVLAAATGTALAVGLGEFGAAAVLARPAAETMPVATVRLASRPGAALAGQSAALAVLLAALTAFAAIVASVGHEPGSDG